MQTLTNNVVMRSKCVEIYKFRLSRDVITSKLGNYMINLRCICISNSLPLAAVNWIPARRFLFVTPHHPSTFQ